MKVLRTNTAFATQRNHKYVPRNNRKAKEHVLYSREVKQFDKTKNLTLTTVSLFHHYMIY